MWPARLLLSSSAAALCHGDILDRLIAPIEREVFQVALSEQRYAYFPHNESAVSITLDHVAEWFGGAQGAENARELEVLPHPATGRELRGDSKALARAQEAFLKGHSMVINSLHKWSEPGMRLARELFEAVDLPIDVYMYLTPPHSKSYGLHKDVMDAWMVQVAGAKTWRLCEKRSFGRGVSEEGPETGKCETVTVRGGDVLYVPFCTLHRAETTSELSSHLTVNVERQYYVWATLLLAILHKVVNPGLTVEQLLRSGDFRMEGETALERALMLLMDEVPRLVRIPLGEREPQMASRWLTRPLSRDDLPQGYLPSVLYEYRSVVGDVAAAVSAGALQQYRNVELGGRKYAVEAIVQMLATEDAEKAVPWVLELVRVHVVRHFSHDDAAILPPPETFLSLAALRSDAAAAARLNEGAAVIDEFTAETTLARRADIRAALLLEDELHLPAEARQKNIQLQVGSKALKFSAKSAELLHYCLGLFGNGAARGQPFLAGSVPGSLGASEKKAIKKLVLEGLLRVVSPPAEAAAAA